MRTPPHPPVSDREKALLSNIAQFNHSELARGWQVRSKSLTASDLAGIQLTGALFEEMDLDRVRLAGSRIEQTTFKDVSFVGTCFDAAVMTGVQFVDCAFAWNSTRQAALAQCNFRGCTFGEGRMEDLTLTACRFEGTTFENTALVQVAFKGGTLAGCNLRATTLSRCDFEDLLIADCELDSVRFPHARGKLTFTGTTLANCGFDRVELSPLAFRGCIVQGVSLTGLPSSDIEIEQMKVLRRLSVIKSKVGRMAIRDCEKAAELLLLEATVQDLSVRNTHLYCLRADKSEFGGTWQDSVLHGVALNGTLCRGLNVQSTTLEDYLILRNTTVENLRTRRLRYARGLRVVRENVRYEGGEEFSG